MSCNNRLTKIANMEPMEFSLTLGFIVALLMIPLVLLNISTIEKNLHIPKYEEVTEVCVTYTCIFPLKLDKPELRETRPGTVLSIFLFEVVLFSILGYFIHCGIVNKVYF